jgi:long-subunit acyl-CoA synthetase (AMP-forming)
MFLLQLVTSGGKNVAPVPIEDRLKSALKHVVSNVVVVGDRRKFLSTLITVKVNVDPVTLQPTNQLTDEVEITVVIQEGGAGGLGAGGPGGEGLGDVGPRG